MENQERQELCEKLDRELDEYLESLERKPYTDGWPEDRWREEMDKHPFFMKEIPKDMNPDNLDPLLVGLQQLKYGEDDNTPEELAKNYKEDGNWNFRHGKFKTAFVCYTKALAAGSKENEINCQSYSNRALCQLKLQNYRSAYRDAKEALKIDPKFLKALHTAAKCALKLREYDICGEHCSQILMQTSSDQQILALQKQAIQEKRILERNLRLQKKKDKNEEENRKKVLGAIKKLNINVQEDTLFEDQQYQVHLDENDQLVWPVVLIYPENGQTDFIEGVNELSTLEEHIHVIYEEPPAWDKNKRYKPGNVNAFFNSKDETKFFMIDVRKSIREILQHKEVFVKQGTIMIFIVVKGSEAERQLLQGHR